MTMSISMVGNPRSLASVAGQLEKQPEVVRDEMMAIADSLVATALPDRSSVEREGDVRRILDGAAFGGILLSEVIKNPTLLPAFLQKLRGKTDRQTLIWLLRNSLKISREQLLNNPTIFKVLQKSLKQDFQGGYRKAIKIARRGLVPN